MTEYSVYFALGRRSRRRKELALKTGGTVAKFLYNGPQYQRTGVLVLISADSYAELERKIEPILALDGWDDNVVHVCDKEEEILFVTRNLAAGQPREDWYAPGFGFHKITGPAYSGKDQINWYVKGNFVKPFQHLFDAKSIETAILEYIEHPHDLEAIEAICQGGALPPVRPEFLENLLLFYAANNEDQIQY